MLFSATQTTKVSDLARISLRPGPLLIDVDSEKETSTVSTLSQGYVVRPSDRRFLLLFTFLKKNLKKKVVVFFSSSVGFTCQWSCYRISKLNLFQGKQKQQKRTTTFFEFCNAETGILLCTDVGARGLDIPRVDWVVQFDPPDDPRDYIHRVGRTARAGKVGKSLLFLLPSELGFLRYLKEAKVPLNEFSFPSDRIANVQSQVRPLSFNRKRDADDICRTAREVVAKELLPPPVGARRLSLVFAVVCVTFVEEDIRYQLARPGESWQGIWVCSATTGECDSWWWIWRVWTREPSKAPAR